MATVDHGLSPTPYPSETTAGRPRTDDESSTNRPLYPSRKRSTDRAMSEDANPLFARALGDDWSQLHDAVRERYDLTSEDDSIAVGTGTMDRVTAGTLARPALYVLACRDAAVTTSGTDVPFEVRSIPFQDAHGREALVIRRRFEFASGHQFFEDAIRWDPEREQLLDFLGTGGRIVAALEASVDGGSLRFDLAEQWFWTGERYRRIPDALAVDGTVVDSYDDERERYGVDAAVTGPVGTIFEFQGTFETERADAPDVHPTSAYAVRDRLLPEP